MSSSSRSILITSASGNIGQKLIPLLLSTPSTSSHTFILPTRDAARLRSTLALDASISSLQNLIIAEGDTTNTPWIESLLRTHSVDTVLSNYSGVEELILTMNLWAACEATGVKHLLYISACFDTSLDAVRAGALRHVRAAHCVYKYPAEQMLMHGAPRFSWTILGPTLFFQTEARFVKENLLEKSVYSFPCAGAKGCSRVDAADIALGVLRAVEDAGRVWGGKKVMIGTWEAYTTEQVARIWGEAMEKEIRVVGVSWEELRELEKRIVGFAGQPFARDLVLMCKDFDTTGFGMTEEQYLEQVKFLNKEPESYEEHVKSTVASWKAEAQNIVSE